MATGTALAEKAEPRLSAPEGAEGARLLVARAVNRTFGTTRAVQDVDFEVGPSEIVGLMGGNGAGKSTLVKIIGGLTPLDSGEIDLLGTRIGVDHSPRAAMAVGVRLVHQELSLCLNLRVFENFAVELPDLIKGARWKKRAVEFTEAALAEVFPGNSINPRSKVGALSLSQRQMVEIARAVSHPDARLIILDEPTSSLGSHEADQLRAYMKRRRSSGTSFIFISHRLRETLDLTDRVTVMRNGRVAWSGRTDSISQARLVELLGGSHDESGDVWKREYPDRGQPSVRVTKLTEGTLRGVTFAAHRGEVLGLAGLEGSGQRQILQAIFSGKRSAAVEVDGRVAFVSGDRTSEGVFPLWSIDENITVSSLKRHSRWGIISIAGLRELAKAWFQRLDIRAQSGEAPILSLSGGNQQKAVIARALATSADVLLLDDPTRGVDLGTKAQIYALLRELAAQGRTVIWYSTDDAEFAECDRTLVMRDGAIVSEFRRDENAEKRVVEASFRRADDAGATSHAQVTAERARRREQVVTALIPLVTFAAVFAWCVFLNPRIGSPFGLMLVFSAAFALAFAAISQLFIIAAGDIDLGVGTFIGLVNAVAATWLVTDPWLAVLCFAGMLLAYPLMGLFIEARRVPAIIVTLGLSFVWLGLASLRLPRAGGAAPDWLVEAMRVDVPLVPLSMLLCVVPALAAYLILMVWRYGAVLRGFGASPRAIEAAGWSPKYAKATLYGFAGTFAFLTGILVTASTRGGDPTGSVSMTLLSVAAVILGGAAFSGGVVAPFGALFGTLTLVLVGTLLSLLGVNAVFLPMVQGGLLLGAVGVRTLLLGRTAR